MPKSERLWESSPTYPRLRLTVHLQEDSLLTSNLQRLVDLPLVFVDLSGRYVVHEHLLTQY